MSGEVVCLNSADALEEFRSLAWAAALSSVLEVSNAEVLVGQVQPTFAGLSSGSWYILYVLYREGRTRRID